MINETQGGPEAPAMVTKAVAEYGPGLEGQDCLSCQNFMEPDRCKRVLGEVAPTGGCSLHESQQTAGGMGFGDTSGMEEILFGMGGM